MKIKKILSGVVAGTLALSTLAGMSFATSAEEAVEATSIKTWMSDASTKASAWWGDANKDPFAFGGDKDKEGNPVEYPLDWSQAKSLEVKLLTATDNINGSFGVGTGEDFTWASADWSINYDFAEEMWMLEDSDKPEITVATEKELPGEGNVYTVTYTDIPTILGATPSAGATAEFKLNGYNRVGEKKAWVETPVDLISVVVKDADGNTIFELPVAEDSSSEIESSSEESSEESSIEESSSEGESSSEIESSSEEESSSEVEVEPTWTDNNDGTFTLATHYLKDSKDNNSLSIDPAKLGITDPSKVRSITLNATTTGENAYYAFGLGADDAVNGWTQAWNNEDTPDTVTVEFPNGLAESWPYFQTSWNNKGENTLTISFEVTFAADPEPAEAGDVKYQVSSDKTAIRFVYVVDEAVVAAAENGAIDIATADGVTTTPVVKAYKSLKAGGQTISAGEGKVFIISPTVKNVASDVTATFKLDGVKDATRTYTYAG